MRKRHLNVTEKELEAGHEYYSVTCLQLSRTVNPNIWNEENYDHELEEWFPEGYMCEIPLKPKRTPLGLASIASESENTSCSVEARESMENYILDQNEKNLSICEVY